MLALDPSVLSTNRCFWPPVTHDCGIFLHMPGYRDSSHWKGGESGEDKREFQVMSKPRWKTLKGKRNGASAWDEVWTPIERDGLPHAS